MKIRYNKLVIASIGEAIVAEAGNASVAKRDIIEYESVIGNAIQFSRIKLSALAPTPESLNA
ncbi:hypothetical protein Hbl1158_16765 (plasmid) [Halobaculum sp. CBA1158]|uniref:hypothetical protein n=1 Tax=Halobaculum sp. CBA1158 TaxID=2904243 RepID=UPI001F3F0EBE|nr:hypothetical protein [Halobaculum sp. CBA1158]UIP01606.1 hypothetical protein Hbl1158_16765 [Halobaculum sp. CBA1158]